MQRWFKNKLQGKNKDCMDKSLVKKYWVVVLFAILQGCQSPGDDTEIVTEPQVHEVEIRGMKFVPDELWVNSGDMVVFTNKDMVVHDVTQDPGREWTSMPIPVDSSWKKVFRQTEDFFCTIHPVMKGKIKVR